MSGVIGPAERLADAGYRRGVLLVLLAGVLWSSMGIGVRYIEVANVWQILFIRSATLSVFLFCAMTVRARGVPWASIRGVGLAGVIGGASLVFAFSGGIYAIQATTVANAMFLFAAAPFFAALIGRAVLGERVRRATWFAMAVAGLGIAIMVWQGVEGGRLDGNVAAIISALGFAVFTVAVRWGQLGDMIPTVFLAGLFATMTGGTVCLIQGYGLDLPAGDFAVAAALGLFQVGAGLVVYTIGSKTVPAAEAALLSMTEVVFGPLWVWLVLGETATGATLIGGAVLMGALVANVLSGIRRKPPPPVI
ncbi:MAG: DMT family transporter [Rhodospirillales bacterium]